MLINFEMKQQLKRLPLLGRLFSFFGAARYKFSCHRLSPARNLKKLVGGGKGLTIVQIGSNVGSTDDPIHSLLDQNPSYHALLVEPVPHIFKLLCKNYSLNPKVRFANVAIGAQNGVSDFYFVNPLAKDKNADLPLWADQIGSFDRSHIVKHLGDRSPDFILSENIQILSLPELFELYEITSCDVIHIDAEGSDWLILQQLDFSRFKPHVILFEHKHLSDHDKQAALDFCSRNYSITDLGADFLCQAKR